MTRMLRRPSRDRLAIDGTNWKPLCATDHWFSEQNQYTAKFLVFVSPVGDSLPEAIAATVDEPHRWTVRHVGECMGWDTWVIEPLPG